MRTSSRSQKLMMFGKLIIIVNDILPSNGMAVCKKFEPKTAERETLAVLR